MGKTRSRKPALSEPISACWENQILVWPEKKTSLVKCSIILNASTLIFPAGAYPRVRAGFRIIAVPAERVSCENTRNNQQAG